MADGFIGDSTYGSLSCKQSSSSSFTMSLSGSDTVEDQPSTSGCSSDMTHSKNKQRRKECVKHYLKQLKAMVPPAVGTRGKIGTLSALQHVVDSMKKIQEEKSTFETQSVSEKGLTTSFYEGDGQLPQQILQNKNCLRLTLRRKDVTVMEVTQNLSELLGYPELSWKGRELASFIHRKDVVTLNSNLAYGSERETSPNQKEEEKSQDDIRKYFYLRIRHYKGLQSGFSLKKKDHYTAFQAAVVMEIREPVINNPDNIDEGVEDESRTHRKYLVLECIPLKSAYEVNDLHPNKLKFNTRHTLFCTFSYMHQNAIPLTGYMPQDLIGMSIFHFYHPDDLEKLYYTYKQVLSSKGSPIKGVPIRFRTSNGSYVVIETEWSSFTNPWSRRLEFIIGQHTIVKEPDNLNVFGDYSSCTVPNLDENAQKWQQKIRELLLQPIVQTISTTVSAPDIEPNTPPLFSVSGPYKRRRIQPLFHKSEGEKNLKNSALVGKLHDHGSKDILSTDSSQPSFPEDRTSVAYEQLNYTNNIKKFLLSQSKSENKSPSSNEESDEVEFQDSDEMSGEVDAFEVDISVPKPPSFGSSTKVLLSEQGQREEVPSSPAHQQEYVAESSEPVKENQSFQPAVLMSPPPQVPEIQDHPMLMHLTEETLQKHTKIQEKMFVNQAKQERNLMMKQQEMTDLLPEHQSMKRTHSPDEEMWTNRANKSYKKELEDFLQPPFPLCMQQQQQEQERSQGIKAAYSLMSGNYAGSLCGMYPAGVPCGAPSQIYTTSTVASEIPPNQTEQNQAEKKAMSQNLAMKGKMQWPYYPQAGVSFIPQVMGGFYHPQQPGVSMIKSTLPDAPAGIRQAKPVLPVNLVASSVPKQGHKVPPLAYSFDTSLQSLYSVSGNPIMKSSSEMSSNEGTSSSFLYLLEIEDSSCTPLEDFESLQSKCCVAPSKRGIHKRVMEPPWLQTVNWSPKLAMMYTLPRRKKNRVLKEDRDSLCKMKSSEMVSEQMNLMREEAESSCRSAIIDEESDYLFPLDESELQKMLDNSMSLSDEDSIDSPVSNLDVKQESSKLMNVDKCVTDTVQENEMSKDFRCTSLETGSDHNQDKAMSCDSCEDNRKESMYGDSSSVECESDYSKASSNLTPSDQRSNEENCSSMKESDYNSKEMDTSSSEGSDSCSNQNKKSSDDVKMKGDKMVPVSVPFDIFFVPNPVKFAKKDRKIAPWLMDTEMNQSVAMEYSVSTSDLQNRLKHDKLRLQDMKQPNLVKQQFDAMLEELCIKKNSPGIQRARTASHQCRTSPRRSLKLDDQEFNSLFNSMFTEDTNVKKFVVSDSMNPDIEDVLDSLNVLD